MPGPLTGITVVELGGIGPTPFAGMMLADMGAVVIRVERVDADPDLHDALLRGRRSIAVDLKDPQGVEVVLRLIDHADAVIEGFRPGVVERLGLGPDICFARNSALVYGRMTGWGQTGQLAHQAGHDLNYIAVAGVLAAIGNAGEPPAIPLNLVGDNGGGGMLLAFGVVSALLESKMSGKGQVIDAAMVDGAALLMAPFYGLAARGLWGERGTNVVDSGSHFYGVYRTSDGHYVSIGAIERPFYTEFLRVLGFTEDDLPTQFDSAHWPLLKKLVAEQFALRTRDEWCAAFEGVEACFAPVLGIEEATRHPINVERDVFVEVAGIVQPAPAPRFSRTPAVTPVAPSMAGAHTDEILESIGYDKESIAKLRSAAAVG